MGNLKCQLNKAIIIRGITHLVSNLIELLEKRLNNNLHKTYLNWYLHESTFMVTANFSPNSKRATYFLFLRKPVFD